MFLLPAFLVLLVFGLAIFRLVQIPRRLWSGDLRLAGARFSALRIATLAVGDRDEALDIVQDAMIRLVRRYGDRPGEEWRALFFRILANPMNDDHEACVGIKGVGQVARTVHQVRGAVEGNPIETSDLDD